MALHVSSVIEQEPFGGRGLCSGSSHSIPASANMNIDDSLHLHDDIGALESTVTFSPTWFFGFIFFTLVKFKLTVWIYISWLGLAILFIDPQF